MFSSRCDNLVVPGIGMIQGFLASSQANAICAEVTLRVRPNSFRTSTGARLARIASGVNLGRIFQLSFPELNRVYSLIVPPRNPC